MTFYHATRGSALDAIMREGLKPCDPALRDPALNYQPAGVYMWRHLSDAVSNRTEKDAVVIAIDIPEHWVRDDWEFDSDDDGNSCAVVCASRIRPLAFVAVYRSNSVEFKAQLAANMRTIS